MSEAMELPAFEHPPAPPGAAEHAGTAGDLGRLSDVPVELAVEIGRARMTVGATLELRPGSIVVLDRMAGEPVDLLVNGTPIARGEVVVIDEEFALRVTEVIGEGGGGAAAPVALAPADAPDLKQDASEPITGTSPTE
jgi:flagellar motor switch protein FliN